MRASKRPLSNSMLHYDINYVSDFTYDVISDSD